MKRTRRSPASDSSSESRSPSPPRGTEKNSLATRTRGEHRHPFHHPHFRAARAAAPSGNAAETSLRGDGANVENARNRPRTWEPRRLQREDDRSPRSKRDGSTSSSGSSETTESSCSSSSSSSSYSSSSSSEDSSEDSNASTTQEEIKMEYPCFHVYVDELRDMDAQSVSPRPRGSLVRTIKLSPHVRVADAVLSAENEVVVLRRALHSPNSRSYEAVPPIVTQTNQNGVELTSLPFRVIVDTDCGPKALLYGRYIFQRVCGKGTFARVVKAQDLVTSKLVAIKVFRRPSKYHTSCTEEAESVMSLEMTFGEENARRLLVPLLCQIKHPKHSALIYPLLGPTLLHVIRRRGVLSAEEVRYILVSLADILSTLEGMKLAHTDIKPENILLVSCADPPDLTQGVRLIDYGNAELVPAKGSAQTRHYRAPEVILDCTWGVEVDMFSVGCMVPELLTGKCLFMPESSIEHLGLMEHVLGTRIPSQPFVRGKRFHEFFSSQGTLRWPEQHDDSWVRSKPTLQQLMQGENFELHDLSRRMMEYNSTRRLRPKELWNRLKNGSRYRD